MVTVVLVGESCSCLETVLPPAHLVSCPRNNIYFAGSQLAVFQGANERPYLNHTGRESNAEKRPTGSGPKGCDENGPAAALLVGHVSIQICSLLAPCRRSILIATIYLLFKGQDTRSTCWQKSSQNGQVYAATNCACMKSSRAFSK